ncbi:MAG: hypothetical protein D6770_08045 [Anaerolineae bacterium]|nr:MAG: hypothetical protein D6770_08045 [Anaerolineae bacterium]
MSCENNRNRYFDHLAQRSDLQAALGLDEQGTRHLLERLYHLSTSVGSVKTQGGGDAQEIMLETEYTKRLFERMKAMGITPPTHSKDGLPKVSARFGYGQIERLLRAVEKGAPLPETVRRMAMRTAAKRLGVRLQMDSQSGKLTAVGFDDKGYYRCGNCGRFASLRYAHVCPFTASADDLERMLKRRMNLPESAYRAYRMDALEALIGEARTNGEVEMRHLLTGHVERVTLDGLPQALMAGFVPKDWEGLAVPAVVDGKDGTRRIVSVLDASGLEMPRSDPSAVLLVAQHYGLSVAPDAPIMDAFLAASAASPLRFRPATGDGEGVTLEGGQEYDLEHFIGTEFRKASARGTFVEIDGRRYGVYARSKDPADRSSARGRLAGEASDIVIGRTLPAAVGILAQGSIQTTDDGRRVEVYGDDGALLAVYDGEARTAGDTLGNPNASPEQMAAVLAYRMLHPRNAFDYALIRDFTAFRAGRGSPIAAADSAYLALRKDLEGGETLRLGARLGVRRCPACGRFVGKGVHVCPKRERPAGQAESAPVQPAAQPVQVQVTVALPEDFAVQVGKAVAQSLGAARREDASLVALVERMGEVLERLAARPAETQQRSEEMAALLERMDAALERLAEVQGGGGVDADALGEALARHLPPSRGGDGASLDVEALGRTIAAAVAQNLPAPAAPVVLSGEGGAVTVAAPPRPARCRKCGQMMSEGHTCPPRVERRGLERPPDLPPTEVEKILDGITMPAPDLYLDSVPEEWGGQRAVPLPENIPDLMPDYEMGDQERLVFNMIAMQLRKKSRKPTNRAFGLYGPAGTGKNTIARQLAASLKTDDGKQGLPYYEVNITPDMDIAQAIGEVVLTTDETGSTVSQVRLGPIGQVAAGGGVIAINEIVRSPKLATALQSIVEDGEVAIPTPEGGTYKIPVHPSAIFITTWNPGYEGDADRPAQAFLSRITALPLDYPSRAEQLRRLEAHFVKQGLEKPPREVMEAAVDFWNELRTLTGGTGQAPQIGALSPTPTTPGPRELARFVEYGLTLGWDAALRTLDVICDQNPEDRAVQQNILRDRFAAHFGALGLEGQPEQEQGEGEGEDVV